jgi:hypothetical protein
MSEGVPESHEGPPSARRTRTRRRVAVAAGIFGLCVALAVALVLRSGSDRPRVGAREHDRSLRDSSAAASKSPAARIASARSGGGGVISATQIGILEIGHSTSSDVASWLGKPDRILPAAGCTDRSASYPWVSCVGTEEWAYRCTPTATASRGDSSSVVRPSGPVAVERRCYTVFGFDRSRLIGVETTNPRFATASGLHVGATLAQVLRGGGVRWSGYNVQCPGIAVVAPAGTLFIAGVVFGGGNPFLGGIPKHPRVNALFVSSDTGIFNDDCPAGLGSAGSSR